MGHDSACALAVGGRVVAALQQERITRRKHDGQDCLSPHIPIRPVLYAAGVNLEDVDRIVCSYQAVAPGGIGLDRTLVSDAFRTFDGYQDKVTVISHHLAHAFSAIGGSGYDDCAVVVCDLAGSSTFDGQDYALAFAQWVSMLAAADHDRPVKTEHLSIYSWRQPSLQLKHREFVVPHSDPDRFVFSAASLYENASRSIFGREDAYGQLMALAAFGRASSEEGAELQVSDLISIEGNQVRWRNDWQTRAVARETDHRRAASLAHVIQQCTEESLLGHARRAVELVRSRRIAVAGGVFLNIGANSRIWSSGLFDGMYVPSAPHDAGIAIGCALYGQNFLGSRFPREAITNDRLGPIYSKKQQAEAISNRQFFISTHPLNVRKVAEELYKGKIFARWHGRSEFGPRALGGRSLIASPLTRQMKERLNAIKGRQEWRPVAPIILHNRLQKYFVGPPDSPFMTFLHFVRRRFRGKLIALSHPDGSTRVQTLKRRDDRQLYRLLEMFERVSGYPILVNTSLNGPGVPIVETLEEATEFFLHNRDIDYLIAEDRVVRRLQPWASPELLTRQISLTDGVVVAVLLGQTGAEGWLYKKGQSTQISPEMLSLLYRQRQNIFISGALQELGGIESAVSHELYALLLKGFIVVDRDESLARRRGV